MQEPEEKKIALELLETEQAYVNRLYLLDQVSWEQRDPHREAKAMLPSAPLAQLGCPMLINPAGPGHSSTLPRFHVPPQQGLGPMAVPRLSSGCAQTRDCLMEILGRMKLYRCEPR